MIRLFLYLFLFLPVYAFADCTTPGTFSETYYSGTGTSCPSPAGYTSQTCPSATPVGDVIEVVTEANWLNCATHFTISAPPPDPVLCPDGTPAPNGDLLGCNTLPPPDPNPNPTPLGEVAAALSDAVSNAINVSLMPVLATFAGRISEVASNIVSAKDYLSQRMGEIASQSVTSITNAISQQTTVLTSAIAGVSDVLSNMSQNMNNKLDQANTYLDHIRISVAALGTNINEAASHITDGITAQTQELMTGLTDVRNAVSSGAAWMVSAVTEGGVNTVNAIRDLHDTVTTGLADISGYLNDAAVNAENSLTSLANISSAIAQLPSQIANAIVTNEGFGAGAASIVQAFNDGVTALTTSLTDIYDSIDSMSGDLIRYGDSIYSKLDDLTTKAADFFAGTPSAMSDKGSAILNEPSPDNPLATPEEVNLDSMLSTTVSGGGGCPAPVSVDVLGGTLYFRYDMLCEWAETVGKLIMILASILSLRIIAKD